MRLGVPHAMASERYRPFFQKHFQDPPTALDWGYKALNSGYFGPNRGEEEGLSTLLWVYLRLF